MKNKELDALIKEALSQEEAAYYNELEEQSVPQMVGGLFHGKMKMFSIMTVVVSIVFTALGFYALYKFMNSEATNDLIKWGAGMFFCLNVTGMMKIWHWMQINKNAVFREMKRIELQIAAVANKSNSIDIKKEA